MGTAGGWHARRESRQGLSGGVAVSRGLWCTTPARAGGSRAARRGDSPRQAARGLYGGATGAPLWGSADRGGRARQLAGWPWWGGRRRWRAGAGWIMQRRGWLTSRRPKAGWPAGKWCAASRGGRIDQLARRGKVMTRSTDPGSRIWRSHPNRCRRYISWNVSLGCHNTGHTHWQIYTSTYMSVNMVWGMDIYLYLRRTGDISGRVDEREGSLRARLPPRGPAPWERGHITLTRPSGEPGRDPGPTGGVDREPTSCHGGTGDSMPGDPPQSGRRYARHPRDPTQPGRQPAQEAQSIT